MCDLWGLRAQVLAITLVLGAATATFVLATGTYRALAETRDAYYARNQFADIFCDMTRAPRSIVTRAAAIPGLRQVEGRIQQFASLAMPGPIQSVRALISTVGDAAPNELNRVTLRQGRLPAQHVPGEIIVDEAFAQANALHLGDTVFAIIYGSRHDLRIVGIGLAPDFIYAMGPGDLVPDSGRFGIFWMGQHALESVTNREGAINSLSALMQPKASEAEVIRHLDALLQPYGATGCYGRRDQQSHAFVENELVQLDAMARVIPPVFLLVAAFLVYIVLSRMVETERGQIGLLKAFGYSNAAVALHYLKFAFAIAGLATLLGVVMGVWMGRAMAELYLQFFRFPFLQYRLPGDVFLEASALAFGATGLGALAGMRSVVRLQPAIAMLPPPPPVYRSGVIERLGQAAGLSAVGHMIVRHIARWPWRSTLTVCGVALSLALLFSTLQFLDSSHTMLDAYFFRAQRQDLTVTFTEPRRDDAVTELRSLRGVLRAEAVRGVPVALSFENNRERALLESAQSNAQLSARIDNNGSEIDLPPSGLMLSRQLADKLGVSANQHVRVQLLDGRQSTENVPVIRIIDEFVGARAYASAVVLQAMTRESISAGAVHLRIDPAYKKQILTRLNEMPGVLGVIEKDAAVRKFEDMINDNMFTMLFFYIGFASAIAVGVVYNSARILFAERAHELATLRVLGYFQTEIAAILLGELALLIAAAVPVGCVMGYWLAQFMVWMFSSDLFRLPFTPERATFAYASLVVLTAAVLTALAVVFRILKLDMVRVLKAHD